MDPERPDGFYWVRFALGGPWEPGEYYRGHWYALAAEDRQPTPAVVGPALIAPPED